MSEINLFFTNCTSNGEKGVSGQSLLFFLELLVTRGDRLSDHFLPYPKHDAAIFVVDGRGIRDVLFWPGMFNYLNRLLHILTEYQSGFRKIP